MRTHRFDRQAARPPAIREVCLTGGPDQKYIHTVITNLPSVRPTGSDRVRAHTVVASLCVQR